MRLRHEADPVARSVQNRGQAGRRRAFAVGAGDQRAREPVVGLAEAVENGSGAFGAELHPEAAQSGDICQRLGVRHEPIVAGRTTQPAPSRALPSPRAQRA